MDVGGAMKWMGGGHGIDGGDYEMDVGEAMKWMWGGGAMKLIGGAYEIDGGVNRCQGGAWRSGAPSTLHRN